MSTGLPKRDVENTGVQSAKKQPQSARQCLLISFTNLWTTKIITGVFVVHVLWDS